MAIEDRDRAAKLLSQLNYYRLSGYWYPMRKFDSETNDALDEFRSGASFNLVLRLYKFDEKLRHAVFTELDRIELAIRSMLGHELGRIDPLIHLHKEKLNEKSMLPPRDKARTKKEKPNAVSKQFPGNKDYKKANESPKPKKTVYEIWFEKYELARKSSREDFVKHHEKNYDEKLPIWAAVEIMDWGMLSKLYSFAPNQARKTIADTCDMTEPQLESWLKSLNILRNYSAHHARMFNRVYSMKPKLPQTTFFQKIATSVGRTFGQLTLIQYLLHRLELGEATSLPETLNRYPDNDLVPFKVIGAPSNWQDLEFWR